jgi:CRP-like cAMP-binding protein
MVRKLEIYVPLQPDDRDAVLALPYTLKSYDASAYLVREGEVVKHCAVLLSGFAFRHKITNMGMRQIVSVQIPGDALDFQHVFLEAADHNLQTATRVDVALITKRAILDIARSRPAISDVIFASILVELSILRECALNLAKRDARTRLAHFLCELAVRLDAVGLTSYQGYELPLSQEQIGDALGISAVHTNRTIRALEMEGLIARDKRSISFPRWEAICSVAGFSSSYLHLNRIDRNSRLAARQRQI